MFNDFVKVLHRPKLFEAGTDQFWNDEHISKKLLEAHLNPDIDAASRKACFLDQSATWIAEIAPPAPHRELLDLGCGPGLYAEKFSNMGYTVTGIDFSKRSINYAKQKTVENNSGITYYNQNYLTIEYENQYDIVTLIYCDYCALSTQNRGMLLEKIYRALKKNGKLILDVFMPKVYNDRKENRTWEYYAEGGFWSEEPYLCLDSVYHYDEDTTELRQSIVQTEAGVDVYNVWEHFFTENALLEEMQKAGFHTFELYDNIAGKKHTDASDTLCGVFIK